jgi:ubiquinone/menaquinone biosynthesis C-methylase UbiE
VLDVGCGTGAITAGVAEAVGPSGQVIGIDRDEALLATALAEHGNLANLRFECGDATCLRFRAQFDIVTAARTLQWIAEPAAAVSRMKRAAKAPGLLVILDYNHAGNRWKPDPPREFRVFYDAFLAWRQANRWDNEMADHLPELFRTAGLMEVQSRVQDEIVERGDQGFPEALALWSDVIETVGGQIASSGFCTRVQLKEAKHSYTSWAETELVQQTLAMRTVIGEVRSVTRSRAEALGLLRNETNGPEET